jgi:hypothetical protein
MAYSALLESFLSFCGVTFTSTFFLIGRYRYRQRREKYAKAYSQ